jgi:hypothetical protein
LFVVIAGLGLIAIMLPLPLPAVIVVVLAIAAMAAICSIVYSRVHYQGLRESGEI